MSEIRTRLLRDDRFGLDRLSFSFPVRSATREGWQRQERVEAEDGTVVVRSGASVDLDRGGSVYVGVQELVDVNGVVRRFGKVESNPARMVDPDGCGLAPVNDFPDYTRAMWSVATSWLEPECLLPEARLKRVDVARDYRDIETPAHYVRSLVGVPRPYAKRAYVFSNPARGMAETLGVGSGAGMIRLYDQHEAYAEKGAPEGSLRWEVEARAGWLEKVEMKSVGDWTAEALIDLTLARWDWSKCGLQVLSLDRVCDMVLNGTNLSAAKRERLVGRLYMQARGFPVGGGRQVAYDYDRLQAELGIVMHGDRDLREFAGRLDLMTGAEVRG